jgi:hypothetical protein
MRNFVVHSDNKALLLAFYDTCVELGMPVDETWNIKYKNLSNSKYICFEQGDTIQFHNHNCNMDILNLPTQWNEALEAAKEIYLKPKYTGIWKLADRLPVETLNSKTTTLWDCKHKWEYGNFRLFIGDRTIAQIDYKDGKWAALISDTADIWVEIASLPDLKQMELDEAVKQSGLKVGDKGVFDGLAYSSSTWGSGEISGGFSDTSESYEVAGFEYYNYNPCARVVCSDEPQGHKYYFTLDQFKAIQIGQYEAKVEGGNIAFGCQQFTKEELQAIRKLFNQEIDATIKIRGVDITEHMLARLIGKL